jgi:hypothetical protein
MIAFCFLLAAAAAVAFWPMSSQRPAAFSLPSVTQPAAPKHATCREALELVVEIRERLQATETLDDKAKGAIEVLTLCLVNGSELP